MSTFAAFLGAVLVGLITDELLAWSTALSRRLIRWNAKRLPRHLSARFEEEWLAHLRDIPGRLSRVVFAAGTFAAAATMAHAHYRPGVPFRTAVALRGLDVFVACVLLIAVAPLMFAVTVLLLILGGRGLVARRHVGRGSHPFSLFAFAIRQSPNRAQRKVDSVVNAVLQKLRLDELPMTINLLKGDVTLVGPPLMSSADSEHLARFHPNTYQRLITVRPGFISFGQEQIYRGAIELPNTLTPDERRVMMFRFEAFLLTQPDIGVRFVLRALVPLVKAVIWG